ncbi:MAG: hypothetical protein WEB06_04815 [Actinomycetota bacterium]
MTTIQTQAHRGTRIPSSTKVRGVKGFVIGFAALAAAATGIGIAVSGTSEPPATVVAPVGDTNPAAEQREATKRLQENGAGGVTVPESEVVWFQPGKPGIR